MKKRFNKKRTAWVLIAFFIGFVFAPANYAAAYTAADAADELANIYKYIDANDKQSISNARLAAHGLSDEELNDLTNTLVNALPASVLAEFDGEGEVGQRAAVQAELRECFLDLAMIVYNENTVESDLSAYKEAHKVTFQKLFGTSFDVDDLYGLLLAMREEMPRVIYNNSDYTLVVESGSDADLIAQIPNIAKDAADNVIANTEFAAKLGEIGWDTEMLMDTYIALCGDIDDANSSAELALVKAAVRSQIYLYLCDADENIIEEIAADEFAQREVTTQQPAYFQAYIGSQNTASPNSKANVTTWFLWDSSNEQIGINDMYPEGQGTTLELTSEAAGITGTVTGYRDEDESGDPVADWLVRFKVTVSKKPGSGSPGGGGGGGALPGYPIRVQGSTVQESGMVVEIPKDAVKYDTRGDIDRLDKNTINAPANGFIPGYIYKFTKIAEGDFLKPITVTLPYKQSAVDFEKYDLSIYWYDEVADEWLELDDVTVDKDDLTVSGETKKTGYFALIATKKAVPPVEPPVEPELPVLTDISGHWAKDSIEHLVQMGAIAGYPDNTFKPDNPITRAEFAVVLVKAFGLESATGKVFDDTASHWAKEYIATAAANGIVTGYSETEFGPDDLITREQMAIMIVKAAKLSLLTGEVNFSDAGEISDWAGSYVVTAVQNELMKGYPDNTFKPLGNATRAEAVTVIYNALK